MGQSTSTNNDSTGLTFGVELELSVVPNDRVWDANKFPNSKTPSSQDKRERTALLVGNLVKRLRPSFKMIDGESDDAKQFKEKGTFYQYWTVCEDPTIQVGGCWCFEIVSRVLTTSEADIDEIRIVWDAINTYFEVQFDESCSTHVHVKRTEVKGQGYSPSNLVNISKGIAFYEPAVREFIPPTRQTSKYAVSNIEEPTTPLCDDYKKLVGAPFQDLFSIITGKGSVSQGSSSASTSKSKPTDPSEAAALARKTLSRYMCISRSLAWNYNNVWDNSKTPKPTGTLEFRRPPQSIDGRMTLHWATFALSFVEYFAEKDLSGEALANEKIPDISKLALWGLSKKGDLEPVLNATSINLGLNKYWDPVNMAKDIATK